MYIEYTPIELFDEPEQHFQYPAAAATTTTTTIGFGGGEGVENGGIGIGGGFFARKSRGGNRRCSEYNISGLNSNKKVYVGDAGGNDGSIPMGLEIFARIRKLLHLGDSSEGSNRKRRADGDWNSTSQFKYRKVESDFPKIITQSLEEDDLNILPQNYNKVPLVMAQRKPQIQKEKKSHFLRPKTVTKHITNTAFADIEFSDDDEDEIIVTNGRGESFNVRPSSLSRPAISRPTIMSTPSPKVINIPFKQRQPPPPLIEARTGGILASTLMPDLKPLRQPTYSSILSTYTNGFDNAFTNNIGSKGSTPKERHVPIQYNGSLLGAPPAKGYRSIIAQQYQTKDRDKYTELLQQLAPNLYGVKGTSPKVSSATKILPGLNSAKVESPIVDLTAIGSRNRKQNAIAIELSDEDDDDEVSEIIDLADDDLNVLSACSKVQDERECTYDIKKRAAEKKNQLPYVEPVNSLKEKFDLSPVCNPNWLPNFYSKWEQKNLLMQQELAETEKEVKERSAETRRKEREMQECLKHLQIVDPELIVIDDFPEGTEEPEFPEITAEHEAIIKAALFNGPMDQTLISKFNMSITRRDITTLLGKNWLNDEVINFYMNLLTERGELRHSEGLPKVYAMNTFFVPKLQQSGHSGVRRWTRKVDIFQYDVIPVPVHVGGVHWCMAIIHLRGRSIKYYDSMGTPNPRILAALEQYLREESLDKRKRPFDTSNFIMESVRDVPRQMNGSDCGVFSCMFAEYVSRDKEITFSQQHMEYFRHRMILEIVQGKLMQ